jgi:hypothetical protein
MSKPADAGSLKKESAGREGGKFLTPFGRDNSSHKLPNTKGGSFGGSITNLSHSLPGTSANQKGPR